ncbi:hypothetical protein ACFQH5_11435 [Halomonas salifodinae]|uniref:Uncharacterized protein n=1 Tax=Halomonas salifodinae TaxID=438745 RepID=A0ABW2EZL0_9GAMM
MSLPLVYVDTSRVRDGKLEALEAAMTHLAAFVESHVPRLLSYGFFLDQTRTRMTVVAIHPDADSLRFHLDEAGAEFRKFAELIELSRIDVYGQVSDAVLERLHNKARLLGSGTVSIHDHYAGCSC